ncbi:MAG: class I SAM-dependent methyltransferase [Caulobacterales bacterium]|nr:class I SAM-dependent methyltransferase [Caulobacterales bacterium]
MTDADASPRLSPLERARYRASQSLRVAWYAAHYAMARQVVEPTPTRPKPAAAQERPRASSKDVRAAMRRAMRALFEQDLANIAEGLYPPPRDLDPTRLPATIAASRRYFADLPNVDRRRRAPKGGVEARALAPTARYPAYYLQNFHYQTDGWLSRRSAKLYDTQVEVLFTGSADAMRRAALAAAAREIRGRDQREVAFLDVACGAGRFLEQALDAYPRLKATGLDLSDAYLDEARRRLARWPQARLVQANAEATGEPADSFDVVTCIYLLHELPPRVRAIVAGEIARLVKPGGLVVVADSLQTGDVPDLDGLLRSFPAMFHEPYYSTYLDEDLDALFTGAGLTPEGRELAFLTKVRTYRRNAAGR